MSREIRAFHDESPPARSLCVVTPYLPSLTETFIRGHIEDLPAREIGCNTGDGTKIISNVCRRTIGVDLAASVLKMAAEKYSERNIDYLFIDGLKLPFADGCLSGLRSR